MSIMRDVPDAAGGQDADDGFGVFINYRRGDEAGYARDIYKRLVQEFGEESVYFDVAEPPGVEWLRELYAAGGRSGVFLAIIGPNWMSRLGHRGPNDPDYVRREIESALRDWPGLVMPVLIDAPPPDPMMLPRAIRGLFRANAFIMHHDRYERDLEDLVQAVRNVAAMDHLGRRHYRRRQLQATSELPVLRPLATDRKSDVLPPSEGHFEEVVDAMLAGTLVPLLGLCVRGSLPDSRQLATELARRFSLDEGSGDLAEVAQRVAMIKGDSQLFQALNALRISEAQPTAAHRFLADFPGMLRRRRLSPRHQMIVTTGYDNALERAFEDAYEPFDLAMYVTAENRFAHIPWDDEPDGPRLIEDPDKYLAFPIDDGGELRRTLIVKLHYQPRGQEGELRWQDNYVVTEDQYIDYLPSRLPIQIRDKLTTTQCLFLGYAMSDWYARVLLRRIWKEARLTERSWAIEDRPDVMEKASWEAVGKVELRNAPLAEYAAKLQSALASTLAAGRSEPGSQPGG